MTATTSMDVQPRLPISIFMDTNTVDKTPTSCRGKDNDYSVTDGSGNHNLVQNTLNQFDFARDTVKTSELSKRPVDGALNG